jgi:hypothetical protein
MAVAATGTNTTDRQELIAFGLFAKIQRVAWVQLSGLRLEPINKSVAGAPVQVNAVALK